MNNVINSMKSKIPGVLLCLVIAVCSWFLGRLAPVIGGPVFAILIGMVLTLCIPQKEKLQSGIIYTSKKILQAAVVFLGFGMNLSQILARGRQSLPIILTTISVSLLTAFILYKLIKIPANNAVLVGVFLRHGSRNGMGRNPRQQHIGNRRNRKNDQNTCHHPDYNCTCHLDRQKK